MKVGPRFRRLREDRHLSQEEVASRIGQVRQVASRFEAPGNDPKISTLENFLSAIGVSFAEFFESKIPNSYANPEHAELHENLQHILEDSKTAEIECVKTAIETFYGRIAKMRKKRVTAKEVPSRTQAIKELKPQKA